MQIASGQLNNHLAKGLRSLYVLHGDEPLLVQEAADAIRGHARKQGFTERSSFTVAGAHFDWGEVLAAAGSMSLFADKQIIEIRIPSGKPGKDGSVQLQQIAGQAAGNDDAVTLVLLPKLDRLSKQSAWFAALDGHGISIELQPVERAALPQWIAQRLQLQQQRVVAGVEGQQTLQFFADQVEGNLLAAYQEIQKLALLYPEGELTLAQVESAVLNVARYDVFKLAESILAGHVARVQRMLEGLQAEGVAEVLVHWAIVEDIRALKRLKDAVSSGRPVPMALKEQRIWGMKERLYERILPKITQHEIDRLLCDAHVVDGIVKGLKQRDWPQDNWQALHRLALDLCQKCK
ncbi:MAG TPA: DNA polymerase III subunit delta [Burkholderiaceae bacterium]|nr:DNA polymerase III subunit delta [Burkholderiaceae bacterium]